MTASPLPTHRLVVLDRDGVINRESADFVRSAEEWVPLAGSIEAIARLSNAGFSVAIASNQSGLARGFFDTKALAEMHSKLHVLVANAGGRIDHIAICPHGPDDNCDCRKPLPGLLHQISAALNVSLVNAPVIGDSLRDLEAAQSAGAQPVLVRTGNGKKTEVALPAGFASIDVYDDLATAVTALLSE
jgi:D-glycero-D-manno-heptose 1,7-bisphosphate phosphatase